MRLRAVALSFMLLSFVGILGATLLPTEVAASIDWERIFCLLCGRASLADGLANLALFLPLGVALGVLQVPPRLALLLAASLSLSIELAQFTIPGRDPALNDLVFNAAGAAMGIAVAWIGRRFLCVPAEVASRLSLLTTVMAGLVFILTDVLLTASLPESDYYGGSAELQTSAWPLRLGGNSESAGFFQGRIDEVRIFRRARTPAEIEADMRTPVTAAARSPDLVAAYNFDEGSGSVLIDLSGHGNTGEIHGAVWSSHGRFGSALAFSGIGDVVMIPHSPSLDLTSAMTLEAWLYPTTVQNGWRAILQKEFDTYFLLSSSRAGSLRPAGGATFGSSTEVIAAPALMPTNRWSHVAVTYEGAVLALYVDGRPVTRRLRWYPGRVLSAAVDGVAISRGIRAESRQLRAGLLSGAPLHVRAIVSGPVPTSAPLVTLLDASRNEILLLAAEGDDVLFRLRTRAAAAELDNPVVRLPAVLRGLHPGDPLVLTLSQTGGTYCVDVNGRSTCVPGFTLGMGWTFFLHSQVPAGWPHTVLNTLWIAALMFPFGFWLRRRWECVLAALVLMGGVLLPCTIGRLSVTPSEIGAAFAAIVAGILWARVPTRRAIPPRIASRAL